MGLASLPAHEDLFILPGSSIHENKLRVNSPNHAYIPDKQQSGR
jgi:hypothetical protein